MRQIIFKDSHEIIDKATNSSAVPDHAWSNLVELLDPHTVAYLVHEGMSLDERCGHYLQCSVCMCMHVQYKTWTWYWLTRSYESILECHWLDLNSINHHIIIWIKMIKIDWISSFLKPFLAVAFLSSHWSFGGLACYGRCLRKGLGHLGWNPNIEMIIRRLSGWCLIHTSPQNCAEVLINTEQMMMLDDISKNCYLNVLQFKWF